MRKFLFWILAFLITASPVLADSQGSATGGTAGTQSTGAGCIYNSSQPTLTTGQQATIQCDANGNLRTTSGAISGTVTVNPGLRTLNTLDVKTVTTGGTAVNAISAGHRTAGGLLCNPIGATINLGVNEIGTAAGTTSSGDTTFILPGQCYRVAAASTAVSVISSDSSHPFSGYGLN